MKTYINTRLLILENILKDLNYSKTIEMLIDYENVYQTLDLDKKLLMFDFEDNDVEAQQLIDTIELQQYYIYKNIEILKESLTIQESKLFSNKECDGIFVQIGLN